jgi:hypothetical protein
VSAATVGPKPDDVLASIGREPAVAILKLQLIATLRGRRRGRRAVHGRRHEIFELRSAVCRCGRRLVRRMHDHTPSHGRRGAVSGRPAVRRRVGRCGDFVEKLLDVRKLAKRRQQIVNFTATLRPTQQESHLPRLTRLDRYGHAQAGDRIEHRAFVAIQAGPRIQRQWLRQSPAAADEQHAIGFKLHAVPRVNVAVHHNRVKTPVLALVRMSRPSPG